MSAITNSDVPFSLIFGLFALCFFGAAAVNGYSHVGLWVDGRTVEADVVDSERDRSGKRTNHWMTVAIPFGEGPYQTRLRTTEDVWRQARDEGVLAVRYRPTRPDHLMAQTQLDHAAAATAGTAAVGAFFLLVAVGFRVVRWRAARGQPR